MRVLLLSLLLCGLVGCGGPTLLLEADPARVGGFGDDGAFGALLFQTSERVRGDRVVDVDVVVPADDDGAAATGPFAPVLLVQGGFATVERYHWLAQHLASRGAVVVAPHYVADLAFFAQGNGADALAAVRADDDFDVADDSALAVGHSLGGVVASDSFVEDEDGVSHLVLLSSVPNPSLDLSRTTGRVLSIAGGKDAKISVDEVRDGAAGFAARTVVAVVDAATHYDFTDGASDSELAGDGESKDKAGARRGALSLVDAMVASQHGDRDGDAFLDTPSAWPVGVHE